jgi:hypothetical protein
MDAVHSVNNPQPLGYQPDTAFQEAIIWAEAQALAALDDDQPSITDLPWRF